MLRNYDKEKMENYIIEHSITHIEQLDYYELNGFLETVKAKFGFNPDIFGIIKEYVNGGEEIYSSYDDDFYDDNEFESETENETSNIIKFSTLKNAKEDNYEEEIDDDLMTFDLSGLFELFHAVFSFPIHLAACLVSYVNVGMEILFDKYYGKEKHFDYLIKKGIIKQGEEEALINRIAELREIKQKLNPDRDEKLGEFSSKISKEGLDYKMFEEVDDDLMSSEDKKNVLKSGSKPIKKETNVVSLSDYGGKNGKGK